MTKYRSDIQSLRGLAVSLVFIHHIIPEVFVNAYLGVDVFFVISGYLIIPKLLISLDNSKRNREKYSAMVQFYKRRVARLAPAFLVSIIVINLMMMSLGSLRYLENVNAQSWCALAGLANWCSFSNQPDYFVSSINPMLHFWSLAVEEQIFLILPVLFLLAIAWKVRYRHVLIISVIPFIFFLVSDSNFVFSYYSPAGRLFEFLAGGLAAKVNYSASKRFSLNRKGLLVLLLMISLSPFQILTVLAIPLAVLFSCALLGFAGNNSDNLITTIMTWLGDRSYSIYLYHFPLILLAKESPLISSNPPKYILGLAVVAITLFFAAASYKYVEKRLYFDLPGDARRITSAIRIFLITSAILATALFFGQNSNWVFHRVGEINFPKEPQVLAPKCTNQECEIKSDNTIILLGDSHAHLLSGSLQQEVSPRGKFIYNLSRLGCAFILRENLDSHKFSSNSRFRECLKHNEMVRQLLSKGNLKVIVAQRSAIYISEGLEIDAQAYREAYFQSLRDLLELDNNILVFGPNPEFPISQSNFYRNVTAFQKVDQIPRSVGRSEMNLLTFSDDLRVREMTDRANQRFYSVIDVFCDDFLCIRSHENEWLFIDESHFSEAGTRYLFRETKNLLDEFIIS